MQLLPLFSILFASWFYVSAFSAAPYSVSQLGLSSLLPRDAIDSSHHATDLKHYKSSLSPNLVKINSGLDTNKMRQLVSALDRQIGIEYRGQPVPMFTIVVVGGACHVLAAPVHTRDTTNDIDFSFRVPGDSHVQVAAYSHLLNAIEEVGRRLGGGDLTWMNDNVEDVGIVNRQNKDTIFQMALGQRVELFGDLHLQHFRFWAATWWFQLACKVGAVTGPEKKSTDLGDAVALVYTMNRGGQLTSRKIQNMVQQARTNLQITSNQIKSFIHTLNTSYRKIYHRDGIIIT